MSQTATDPDNPTQVVDQDKPEEISGFFEDYSHDEEGAEPTGAQSAEGNDDDSQNQSVDTAGEDTDSQNNGDANKPEGEESEPESKTEEGEQSSEGEGNDGEEPTPEDKMAKMQHSMSVQAYENRQLKRRLKELESAQASGGDQTQGQVSATHQKPSQDGPTATQGAPRMPRMEDSGIDYDEDKYAEAMDKYHQSAAAHYRREDQRKEHQQQAEQAKKTKFDNFVAKSNELAATDTEYADLVAASSSAQFSPAVSNAILDSESPAQLHREILKDPDRLDRINSMEPISAVRELLKLEQSLSAAPKEPAPKKVTQAPNPVKVSKGSAPQDRGTPAGYKEDY